MKRFLKNCKSEKFWMYIIFQLSFFFPLKGYTESIYWEIPEVLSKNNGQFLQSAYNNDLSAAIWQEQTAGKGKEGVTHISIAVCSNGKWSVNEKISEAVHYKLNLPSIASAAIGADNKILAAIVKNRDTISVLQSTDLGKTFTQSDIELSHAGLAAPYICTASDGTYLLFAAQGEEEKFSVLVSYSEDGTTWSAFENFISNTVSGRVFLPVHTVSDGKDIVIFQAQTAESGGYSFQLFYTVSDDGGKTFAEPKRITSGFNFQNYRPDICSLPNGNIGLVWERCKTGSKDYSVCSLILNDQGESLSGIKEVFQGLGESRNPKIINFKGEPLIAWTHEFEGVGNLYIASLKDGIWAETKIRTFTGTLLFARPYQIKNHLEILWQEGVNKQSIMRIAPDYYASKPKLKPINFGSKTENGNKKVSIEIKFPDDPSGIAGYSYSTSKNTPPENVEPILKKFASENVLSYEADEDGIWYTAVRVLDYAGNWSDPAVIAYTRDTTPPEKPVIQELAAGVDGFLTANTFSIQWEAPETDIAGNEEFEIAGYTYKIEKLNTPYNLKNKPSPENLKAYFGTKKVQLPPYIKSKKPFLKFDNYGNGLYAFYAAAVDGAGNIGVPDVKYFALNKYIAHTYISLAETKKDEQGMQTLLIAGKGFMQDGIIEKVYIDADGVSPYDAQLSTGDFEVISDILITGIRIKNLKKGMYKIGVLHPVRGIYFGKMLIEVDEQGNIKFGDYSQSYDPKWEKSEKVLWPIFNSALRFYLKALTALILIFAVTVIVSLIRESSDIKQQSEALLTGGFMPLEKQKESLNLRTRGLGLQMKFIIFVSILIISVILILTIPLLSRFSKTERNTLLNGLVSSTEVLLESIASSAKVYLPSKNSLELGFLPNQISALDNAIYVTITGPHLKNEKGGHRFVWATNDKDINDHIDTETFIPGESELKLEVAPAFYSVTEQLNNEARKSVGSVCEKISSLTEEAVGLALNTDQKSLKRLEELQSTIKQLEKRVNEQLLKLTSGSVGSYPEFNRKKLADYGREYLFYKPILYRQLNDSENFVHGMVYVKVSTKAIFEQIEKKRREMINITIYISLAALFLGILGVWVLVSIIVSPLKRLAAHVAMIRYTEDKTALIGKNIKVKSKDEVGRLGATINDMTEALGKAALVSKDLTVGKEIQRMFIPLDVDAGGKKLTSGKFADDNIEFFGYYEGARGVSGDYFNYIKLDDRHYAVIKCDISGKGIPAALIMVEVAALFQNYFKDWALSKDGYKLSVIVSRINDLIESQGFKARFAAFTLCILDSVSGDVYFCNAGDNIVNIYDAAEKKMKEAVLHESSAAGVFPSFMIDMKGGFKVEKLKLKSGDILFLYTDGIEEAKRLFRNERLEEIICAEDGFCTGDIHGTHTVGQDGEELGKERIKMIIEAVFAKKSFKLTKWHNPIKDELFEFDFSECKGTVDEAVLALISIEKIFRIYQDPNATNFDRVQVDKKIDMFLNKHFKQYPSYCLKREEFADDKEYICYTHIREDEQYDDLTILGIRKK